MVAGGSGLITTILGIGLQYFPPQLVTSLRTYEWEMVGGTLFFVGLAVFFFFVYGRLKMARAATIERKNLGAAEST
jgi:hypothetical protein